MARGARRRSFCRPLHEKARITRAFSFDCLNRQRE